MHRLDQTSSVTQTEIIPFERITYPSQQYHVIPPCASYQPAADISRRVDCPDKVLGVAWK